MDKLFLLTTLLLLSSQSFGESVSKKTDKYALVSANSALETLLEIPGVKTKYDECAKKKSDKMADCVWAEVSKEPDLKKQVLDKYNKLSIKEDKNANRVPASEEKEEKVKDALAAKKINLATNYADDPQVQALTAFYKKKLDEVLTPTAKTEGEKGKLNSVDHSKFIDLYESELGKTIVNAFTSYCLETNRECGEIIRDESGKAISRDKCLITEKDRKSNRERNLEELKGNASFATGSEASGKWSHCITEVPKICESYEDKYSKQRACIIVDYVKSARESLIAVNAQKPFWNSELTKNNYNVSANFNNPSANNPNATAEKLTEITAKDIADTSKKVTEDSKALMDKCLVKDADGKDTLGDAESCKAFMSTNKEETEKALTEFQLRQEAQTALLNEKLIEGDPKAIETYLEQEGYSKKEITAILASQDPEIIREKITNRFNNEKAALIEEMKQRVALKTSKEEGQITKEDVTNLSLIKDELSSRANDLVQSVQFNNIVSSYLTVGDEKDENNPNAKLERNVASLFAEVESIEDKEVSKMLLEKIKKAELKKTESTTVNLGLKKLNDIFFKYFDNQGVKKDETKK